MIARPHAALETVELGRERRCDIALVVASMRGGGVERVVLNLAAAFHDKGYRVDIVLVRAEGQLIDLIPPGVRLVALNASRTATAVAPLRRYLRSARPPILIGFAFAVNLMVMLACLGRLKPPSLALSVHNSIVREFGEQPPPWRAALLLATRLLYRRADRIICVSQGVAGELARVTGIPGARIRVINNPVIVGDAAVGPEGAALTREAVTRHDPAKPLVLAAGRLVPAKNFSLFLSAFALVRREIDCSAVILGTGPEHDALEQLADRLKISDNVTLAGFQADPWPFYRRASAFVLSSDWEGLPTVLIEAMSVGTPVIATDCPYGPREILCDGRWGALVPVGDASALAAAIVMTLREGGIDARRRAMDFGAARIAQEYLAMCGAVRQSPAA